MPDHVVPVADGFWNIRGSFKTFRGLLDIGTQASLVRRPSGRFVLLDSYTLAGAVLDEVNALTDGGRAVEAVLNLHPFHTIHVKATAARFPHATLHGTGRHHTRYPQLPWHPVKTEDPELAGLFEDFTFSVPAGVDFVPADEKLHFASVLAFHTASRTLHVDDTLMHSRIPFMSGVAFHPTLKSVLQARPGAVAEFRAWADDLIRRCADVDHLCAAHTRPLLASDGGPPIAERVRGALAKVERVLAAHQAKHG